MDDIPQLLIRFLQKTYGGPNPKRELASGEVVSGLTAITLNAAALLEDARVLSRANRFPRAGALTVLALEELGKVPVLFGTGVAGHVGHEQSWAEFWRDYVHHLTKQQRISRYGRGLKSGGDQFAENSGPYANYLPDELGRILDIYKQRSFYVDFWGDTFVLPGAAEEYPNGPVDQLLLLAEERPTASSGSTEQERRSRIHFEWACRGADLLETGRRP